MSSTAPGISIQRMQALVAIADSDGISRASKFNPTRQSQLSRQLADLERYFGRPLMDKRGGRRVLNDFGHRVVEHFRWTLRGLAALQAGQRPEASPPYVLAAGDSVLHWRVLPRIARIGAPFEIVALPAHDVLARLIDGTADFGIVRSDEVRKTLQSRPIGSIEHALFVPRALLPRGVPDEQLLFEVPIALQVADTDYLERLRDYAARHGRELSIALRCESFPQVLRAVQSGQFGGLLPTWASLDLPALRFRSTTVAGKHMSRLHLAWSPRLFDVRPGAAEISKRLVEVLHDARGG